MMRTFLAAALLVLTAGASPEPDATAEAPKAEPKAVRTERGWDYYRIMVERSIFRRDRRAPRVERVERVDPPEDPDSRLAVKGIVCAGGRYAVFVEDLRWATTSVVNVGDEVGQGKIVSASLDAVEYERDGVVHRIEIGQKLTGEIGGRSTAPPRAARSDSEAPASATGAAPATDAAPASGGDASDILERLRQQRMRELGR